MLRYHKIGIAVGKNFELDGLSCGLKLWSPTLFLEINLPEDLISDLNCAHLTIQSLLLEVVENPNKLCVRFWLYMKLAGRLISLRCLVTAGLN